MRRRVLQVELDRHASIVRGPGAHELVELVTGRPGVWISRSRGYSVQERTARNIVAAAEMRNYDVEVIGRRSTRQVTNRLSPRTPATRSSSINDSLQVVDDHRQDGGWLW